MTRPDYPPEFDGSDWCAVCGKAIGGSTSECQCPECPVCSEAGNLECFGTHMGTLPERFLYEVVWDNGNACDSLGVYDSEEEAKRVGQDWLMDMIAVDSNPAEAAEDYSYEVKVCAQSASTPEDIAKAKGVMDDGGYTIFYVEVDLSEVISHDLEGFLGLLCERVGNPLLMDVNYEVIRTVGDTLTIRVAGDDSEREEGGE